MKEHPWTPESIESLFRSKLDMKKYGKHIRLALTGETTGIGIWDVMALLGEQETCNRLVNYMRQHGIEIGQHGEQDARRA